MKLEERLVRWLAQRSGSVVLRSELAPLGSASQVSKVISGFIREGKLMRVSRGVFVKTRTNRFTGQPSPMGTLESISGEIFDKLGVKVEPGQLMKDYNDGTSTQIPTGFVVRPVGKKRIQRKILVGDRIVQYEKNIKRLKA